ncbi:MAG: VanZ family protein [Clostridiales bacterium]|nr:VanZ family protein [Clostridiales bacterium]
MKKKKFWAWVWVALCILAILLIVPLARTIQAFVSARWGRSLFGYAVLAAVGIAFISIVTILVCRLKIRSPSRLVWLAAVAGLYVYFTMKLWKAPEEAIHFLEYGLLGFLLFNALSYSTRDKSVYLAAFFIGSTVGIFDEILQWVVPGRFWDFRDVGLNALAAGLFQVALWKGIKPSLISEKFNPRSARRISVVLAVNLVLLCLCASNTPQRVAWYASRFPSLSFLLREEPMYEFSLKHKDPEIGIFYSRLSPEELKREDRENSDGNAEVLRTWKDKDYSLFLSHHSPFLHTFLYEMRVRIFRRDRKAEEAARAKKERAANESLFISFKENLILEKYFGQTLEKSTYSWDEDKKRKTEAHIDKNRPYKSPVSRGLIHVKEKTIWVFTLIALILLAVINGLYSYKMRRKI